MTTRRSVVIAAVTAGLTASGCLGFAAGTEPIELSAAETTVADAALADTNYAVQRSESVSTTHTVTVAGQDREVEATNYVSEYQKSMSLGPIEDASLGTFSVKSVPTTEILGRTFNPVEDSSDRQLAIDLQSLYGELRNVERGGTDTVTVLGEDRGITEYRADTEIAGESIGVTAHLLRIDHADDHLVAVGIYPTRSSGEKQRIDTLFEHIQHDSDG